MLRKIRWMFGSAGLGGNATWRCGSTIPDGGSWECDLWLRRWPSWTVPALTAAECFLGYNHRNVEYPASGPPSPHSTAHRDAPPHRDSTRQSETQPPRRGGPPCPPARNDLYVTFVCDVESMCMRSHRDLTWQSETQPPRRGRPLRRPARNDLNVTFVCDVESMRIRSRDGCIACVPRSPDAT